MGKKKIKMEKAVEEEGLKIDPELKNSIDQYLALKRVDIRNRIFTKAVDKRLVITPLLEQAQIKNGAVDLRLGTEFIIMRKTEFSELDQDEVDLDIKVKKYQRRISIQFQDKIVLHPRQFLLGSTLEYVRLPDDLIGYIIGRSSWGRLGLIIATATLIHPNFAGVITLELTNLGEVPIVLRPGRRIAQIAFHECNTFSNGPYRPGKYYASTHPSFSEIQKDKDIRIFQNFSP